MARRVVNTEFGRLLKGSDVVDARKKAVGGVILEVRDAPAGFGSPYIIDFDADLLPNIHSWPCNITQARRIAELTKEDDPSKWEGRGLGLQVVQVNNPKEAKRLQVDEVLVDSLAVAFVVDAKTAAKKRSSKAKYHKLTAAGGGPAFAPVNEDDCPF